jgi:hypothetical protein
LYIYKNEGTEKKDKTSGADPDAARHPRGETHFGQKSALNKNSFITERINAPGKKLPSTLRAIFSPFFILKGGAGRKLDQSSGELYNYQCALIINIH